MRAKHRAVLLIGFVLSAASVGWGEWTVPEKVVELDIPGIAHQPFLSADGLTMYFVFFVPEFGYNGILEAYRDTPDGVFTSKRVLTELDQGYRFESPWVTRDQLRLYYSESNASGNWEIKMAERASVDDLWVSKKAFTELTLANHISLMQSLTGDELTIFWQKRNKNKSLGDWKIWSASRSSIHEPFSDIKHVSELDGRWLVTPHVLPDGLTIYWASGRGTYATEDLYRATRLSRSLPFGNIERLNVVNSLTIHDKFPYVNADEDVLYFQSKRGNALEERGVWVSYWVESDPVAAAGRHLNDALEKKGIAMEVLNTALRSEKKAARLLREVRNQGGRGHLRTEGHRDLLRAGLNIRAAIVNELIAKRVLSKSIHALHRALAILTGDHTHTEAVDAGHEDYEDELMRADLNGDGVINVEDYDILARHWLETY